MESKLDCINCLKNFTKSVKLSPRNLSIKISLPSCSHQFVVFLPALSNKYVAPALEIIPKRQSNRYQEFKCESLTESLTYFRILFAMQFFKLTRSILATWWKMFCSSMRLVAFVLLLCSPVFRQGKIIFSF